MKILPVKSTLLIIDIQEKLLPKISGSEDVIKTALWAVDLAKTIGIPTILTEHCPEKMGRTPPILRSKFEESDIILKVYFSAVSEENLLKSLQKDRKQVVVLRTEAHVCVQQTVLDLVEKKYQVFIIDSGIGSRKENDKERAIERMKQNGVEVITQEMLAFEWLERAGTDLFREVLKKFIKQD